MKEKVRVLVAGIGGASLGTELIKSLQYSENYTIFGCDISKFAFGHYQNEVEESFVIRRNKYVHDISNICQEKQIQVIVPGAEEPSILLAEAQNLFKRIGVHVASNSYEVIKICSNKSELFEYLKQLDIPVPRSILVKKLTDINNISFPCVIKPATGSGGSNFVFLATNKSETELYVSYLMNHNQLPLIQEYIPDDEGEFTIGVLNLPDGFFIGSIALKRMFHNKLSITAKTDAGIISSGYSQGLIEDFADIRKQAESIAHLLNSKGPLNIQGRFRKGLLLPFEINPRFSATTYLRTLAGFNEVDMYIKSVINNNRPSIQKIHYGYYLRSLAEVFIKKGQIKK